MSLTSSIQAFLLDAELPAGESMEDIVLDAQEYGIECLIEMVVPELLPEEILVLEEMIENDTPIQEMERWFSEKVKNYDTYLQKAMEEVKLYLSEEGGDEDVVDEPIED